MGQGLPILSAGKYTQQIEKAHIYLVTNQRVRLRVAAAQAFALLIHREQCSLQNERQSVI